VDPRGKGRTLQTELHSDNMILGLRRLAKAVHRHGARIGPELNYGSRTVNPEVSGLQPWAPSPVPCGGYGRRHGVQPGPRTALEAMHEAAALGHRL
jgi:2,4-dienoyl-CoA reductase-like NADH-dependent reductase (Old Yellow Enzyme family)